MDETRTACRLGAWNKGKLVGQKSPFRLPEIWAIRIRLQLQRRLRELALFDLGIDSKLRACDLVKLRSGTYAMATDWPRGRLCFNKSSASCPVRDHGANSGGAGRVDQVVVRRESCRLATAKGR